MEIDDLKFSCQESQLGDTVQNDTRLKTKIKNFCNRIYKRDKRFFFSSMIISTYTVNLVILFHLTCTFIFLYTTRMMGPVSFMINTLQQLLHIG